MMNEGMWSSANSSHLKVIGKDKMEKKIYLNLYLAKCIERWDDSASTQVNTA